jgi:hypothetical protein
MFDIKTREAWGPEDKINLGGIASMTKGDQFLSNPETIVKTGD